MDLFVEKIPNVRTNRKTLIISKTFYSFPFFFWESTNANCPIFFLVTTFDVIHSFNISPYDVIVNTFITILFTNDVIDVYRWSMEVLDGYAFWQNISDELDKRGINNMELADKAGLSYRTITTQRNRHTIPGAEQLLKMAEALGTSMEALLTGSSESHRKLTEEARLVDEDPDLQALVRAVSRDRSLLRIISAVIESSEKTVGLDRLG